MIPLNYTKFVNMSFCFRIAIAIRTINWRVIDLIKNDYKHDCRMLLIKLVLKYRYKNVNNTDIIQKYKKKYD